jgi:CheY-like chemotaxis protein
MSLLTGIILATTPSPGGSPSAVLSPAATSTSGTAVQPLYLVLIGLAVLLVLLILGARLGSRRKNDKDVEERIAPAPGVPRTDLDPAPDGPREIYSAQPTPFRSSTATPGPIAPPPAPARVPSTPAQFSAPTPAPAAPPVAPAPPPALPPIAAVPEAAHEPFAAPRPSPPLSPMSPWTSPSPAPLPGLAPSSPAVGPPLEPPPPPIVPEAPKTEPLPPVEAAPAPEPEVPAESPSESPATAADVDAAFTAPAAAAAAETPEAPEPAATPEDLPPALEAPFSAASAAPSAPEEEAQAVREPVAVAETPVVEAAAAGALAGAAAGAAAPDTPLPAGDREGPPLILIIEDDERIAKFYNILFSAKGYRVENAHDGVEGVDMATAMLPSLILLDVMMPKMNGLMVLQTLRANPETEATPVVVLSNYMEPPLIQRALQLGAIEYVVKSQARPEQLVNALPLWLEGKPALH